MGEGEPVGEVLGGLDRSDAVERHHGCRDTRHADKLRPPPVTDGHHFNEVRAPADNLFESMNGHGVLV